MITVSEVYHAIDVFAPFATQEKWDCSGLLIGDPTMPAERIYVTVDISLETLAAAKQHGAQLMVAHHPVIFSPMTTIAPSDVVWSMIQSQMAAICVHTPLDMAPLGINWALHKKLKLILQLNDVPTALEMIHPAMEMGIGWIDESQQAWSAKELADTLRQALDCNVVRYSPSNRPIRNIAFASGSGSSLLEQAIAKGCDALITGDVKHDRWYAARNAGIALIDCGHYHTEQIAAEILSANIQASLPQATVICDPYGDPVQYAVGGNA